MLNAGIVILTYNDWKFAIQLIEQIRNYNVIKKIVIVDNCSTNEAYSILKEYTSIKIDVIQTKYNGGYSYGNNIGAKHLMSCADIDIIFFSNPDIIVEEKCINEIVRQFENSQYSVLSAVMLNENGLVDKEVYWPRISYREAIFSCFALYRRLKGGKEFKINYNVDVMDVDVLTGAFFAIRKEDFCQIGMFDEHVFLFSEENILAEKLKKVKKKEGLLTYVNYQHLESKIINNNLKSINKIKIFYRSRIYYFRCYRNIGIVKVILMLAIQKISLAELYVYRYLKKLTKG